MDLGGSADIYLLRFVQGLSRSMGYVVDTVPTFQELMISLEKQGQSVCGPVGAVLSQWKRQSQRMGFPGKGKTAEKVELEMILKEAEDLSGQVKGRCIGGWDPGRQCGWR